MNLINALTAALQTQLLSAGILLMLMGSLLVMAKKWPLYIGQWIQRRLVIEVDVHSSSEVFDWLALWLDEQPYSRRARRLTASAKYFGPKPRLIFSPSAGNHVFIFNRRLIWLTRERKEPAQGQQLFTVMQVEYFHLRVLGRRQVTVREMLEAAQRAYLDATQAGIKVFASYGWGWTPGHELTVRPFNSVILPAGVAESLLGSAREFRVSAEWYKQIGIPYRLSFCFYGIPGSGKTSLVAAMAGELRMNLYMLNLGGSGMNDEKLSNLMSEIRSDSIILFEDIDAAVRGRNIAAGEDGTKGVTFSGLVNALDGISAREGCLIFMTTNHRDQLDPALVRPGRADIHQEFTYAVHEQVVRLFLRFFPDASLVTATRFASLILVDRPELTMAEAQQHLLKHRQTAKDALNALQPFSERESLMGIVLGQRYQKPERRRVKPTRPSRMDTPDLIQIYEQSLLAIRGKEKGTHIVSANLLAQANRILGPARAELKRRGFSDEELDYEPDAPGETTTVPAIAEKYGVPLVGADTAIASPTVAPEES